MKKLLIFILLLAIPILVTPEKSYASYCDYSDVARYKKIASNINYSYEYEEIDDNVIFHVTLVNLDPTLFLIDSNRNVYYTGSDEIIVDAKSGENLLFYVYPIDKFCDQKALLTIRIQLPTYNSFYKDAICTGIENYSLCNKWSTHNLSYEKFIQNVTEYKQSLIKNEETKSYEQQQSIFDFILKYYYVYLIAIILISGGIIYTKNKKSNIYN